MAEFQLRAARRGYRGFTLVELLVVIAIIGILVALLLPAVQAAREAARRSQCVNNLKQIGLAIMNYESSQKKLPPGSMGCDGTGTAECGQVERTSASMFLAILPYMEMQPLYDSFNIETGNVWTTTPSGSWDTPWLTYPNKVQGVATVVEGYRCPSTTGQAVMEHSFIRRGSNYVQAAQGNYAAVHGAMGTTGCDFSGAGPGNAIHVDVKHHNTGPFVYLKSRKIRQISDGMSNTMFVGEVDTRPVDRGTARASLQGVADRTLQMLSANAWSFALRHCDSLRTTYNPLNTLQGQGVILAATLPGGGNNGAFGSEHPGGASFVYGDGRVEFLTDDIDSAAYWVQSTIAYNDLPGSLPVNSGACSGGGGTGGPVR
ncbi:DUF1559 family PulG-like putative transporter [Aeoliella sp. SH292]|uniref:DUF1559 family PulG-like putative transporter n=1 Tax=Aeoliella sp. SH292 TaxID=3454464 RepID=UPI003F97A567